jgi:hypothetical protein
VSFIDALHHSINGIGDHCKMVQKETNAASLMKNHLPIERKPIDFGPAKFPMIAQFKRRSKPSARKSTSVVRQVLPSVLPGREIPTMLCGGEEKYVDNLRDMLAFSEEGLTITKNKP